MLNTLAETLAESGRTIVAASTHPDVGIDAKLAPSVLTFVDHDAAIEWCEDRLLLDVGSLRRATSARRRSRTSTCSTVSATPSSPRSSARSSVRTLRRRHRRVPRRRRRRLDVLPPRRAASTCCSRSTPATGDRSRRLATFGQGVAFGEMALLDEGRRSADVVCDEPCTVAELSLAALHRSAKSIRTCARRSRRTSRTCSPGGSAPPTPRSARSRTESARETADPEQPHRYGPVPSLTEQPAPGRVRESGKMKGSRRL